MNTPSFSEAEITEQKVIDYLLRLDHPEGGSKARFFLGRGFSVESWKRFAGALREQAVSGAVADVVEGRFGTKFVVDARIYCPDTSSPMIWTVWIVPQGEEIPRLVTAHPLD